MAAPLPVVVGVAQFNPRAEGLEYAPDPLEMMTRVSSAAAEDCGQPQVLNALDAVTVVNIICWSYQNAPAALAAALTIEPRQKIYTSIGGNTPQYLVNHFASEISAGRMRAALIAGAEAMHSVRRLMKRGGVKWGSGPAGGTPTMLGESRPGTNALEERYGARWPVQIYPLFENARRAHHGWSFEQHRDMLGRLCASMSQVAADNPYAWFRRPRTAQEVTTPGPDNRMICFPYPKVMNAIIDVDQAAALIVTSDQYARNLGIRPEKMVYLHAGAEATERWFISERANFFRSGAMAAAITAAIGGAARELKEISFFDLYSCFPAAVGFALDSLGLTIDDNRGVTVTGGLPYAGGPGNNYSTHAIATMVERLRTHPGQFGLVTALGWYMTKHAAGVYSASPPDRPFVRRQSDEVLAPVERSPAVRVIEEAKGDAIVETYTVTHDREGKPAKAIIVGRLDDGARFFAGAPPEALVEMEREEFIARRGRVRKVEGLNLFEL